MDKVTIKTKSCKLPSLLNLITKHQSTRRGCSIANFYPQGQRNPCSLQAYPPIQHWCYRSYPNAQPLSYYYLDYIRRRSQWFIRKDSLKQSMVRGSR